MLQTDTTVASPSREDALAQALEGEVARLTDEMSARKVDLDALLSRMRLAIALEVAAGLFMVASIWWTFDRAAPIALCLVLPSVAILLVASRWERSAKAGIDAAMDGMRALVARSEGLTALASFDAPSPSTH